MERLIDREQYNALQATRSLRSPGGVAMKLGCSRQRVMQQYQKRWKTSGFLAWKMPAEDRRSFWSRPGHYVWVDLGWLDDENDDPTAWQGQDPEQILAEAMRRYSELIVERARSA